MNTILVPLDGSERSDEVLPVIRSLVLAATRKVHLLRVIPPFDHAATDREPGGGADAPLQLRLQAAGEHLESLTTQLEAFGAEVVAEARVGAVCETILAVAQQIQADMIAMVTHGKRGPLRWLRGSVAESLLRSSPVPLLLVNAKACERAPGLPLHGRVLVPLDGTQRAAQALPPVAQLAHQLESDVTLLRCINPVGIAPAMPPAPPVGVPVEALDPDAAAASLAGPRYALGACGVHADIRVEIGAPAEQILRVAEDEDADLIAMATHGRDGFDRLLLGSVAESVLRDCPRPLLLVNTEAEPVGSA